MNIQKLVDSLDSNELKNLAKAVEKKLEKSDQEKAISALQDACTHRTPIDFYGQKCMVDSGMICSDFGRKTLEFYLNNGSKIVFNVEGR